MPKVTKNSENAVWVFCLRWSVPHTDENLAKLTTLMKVTCANWIFQAEDTTDNPHYQIYCRRVKKIRAKQWAVSLNGEFSGIYISPASTAGKVALSNYAMKKDTRVAGPWSDKPIYLGQDLPVTLWKWQRELWEEIQGVPHPRKIIFVVNRRGNIGKSTFAKWLFFHHGILTLPFGTAKDLANLVSKFQGKSAYIFDLARTRPKTESFDDVYSTLEAIKNGYVVNLKYETSAFAMAKPHVIVFSNEPPKMTKLSRDKYDIRYIEPEDLVH